MDSGKSDMPPSPLRGARQTLMPEFEQIADEFLSGKFHPNTRCDIGSDLTYVRVGMNWNYICVLIDLFNREIIGYRAGPNKTADLVKQAFQTVSGDLRDIRIFHTDRGNEFKNNLIDETLEGFEIKRSLSHKGCPYDNAVAEVTFKIIKTEFVRNQRFCDAHQLQLQLSDYVNWLNNHRIHSSIDYMTPVEYRINTLKKVV